MIHTVAVSRTECHVTRFAIKARAEHMLPFIIIRCRSGLPNILAALAMHPGGCTAFDVRDLVERAAFGQPRFISLIQ